jgi:hypothetical protein
MGDLLGAERKGAKYVYRDYLTADWRLEAVAYEIRTTSAFYSLQSPVCS